jgi:hypothetical protein
MKIQSYTKEGSRLYVIRIKAEKYLIGLWCLMPLSTIFQLLVEETGVPRENHQPATSH